MKDISLVPAWPFSCRDTGELGRITMATANTRSPKPHRSLVLDMYAATVQIPTGHCKTGIHTTQAQIHRAVPYPQIYLATPTSGPTQKGFLPCRRYGDIDQYDLIIPIYSASFQSALKVQSCCSLPPGPPLNKRWCCVWNVTWPHRRSKATGRASQ